MSGDICDICDCQNLGGSGAIPIKLGETKLPQSLSASQCAGQLTTLKTHLAENAINVEGEKT